MAPAGRAAGWENFQRNALTLWYVRSQFLNERFYKEMVFFPYG